MNIWGNTTPNAYWRGIYSSTFPDDVSTSLYAIDFNSTQASNVENVSINGFQYGVREGHRCQVNTYTNLHISYIRFACILYSAAESAAEPTDSVWTRCHFNTCQHVVKTTYDSTVGSYSGDSLQIRFDCCEFMNTSDTVFILTDRAKDWVVVNCYAENVCADATVTGRCMFDVGSTGVGSLQTNPSLLISGGQYAGDSNSGSTFLKTDYTAGVSLIGTVAKRFGTGISCTTNTRANSIYVSNYQCITVTTEFSGTDGKLVGIVRSLDLADGNDSIFLKVPYITYPTGVQITGPTLTLGDSSTASVYVVDGADLGVGEASPTSPLHTAGTTNDGSSLVQFFQSGTGRAIHVVRNVAAATRQMVNFAQLSATGGSTAVVHIQQADTGETALAISTDGSTEKFTVSDVGDVYAAGSVGIGTSVPTHKLHNTGTTRLDARVTVKKSSNSEFATTIVTSGSAIAIDLDDADNFNVTLNASAALSNPTNITVGQSGCIVITHGSTLTDISSWGSYWHFEEGTAPTLSEDAVVDNLVYFVASATSIHAVLLKDMS
jgi:hypothetical protein